MKQKTIILLVILFLTITCSSIEYFDLRGVTNEYGETELFYRKCWSSQGYYNGSIFEHIYEYDLILNQENLFLFSQQSWDVIQGYECEDIITDFVLIDNQSDSSIRSGYFFSTFGWDRFGFIENPDGYLSQWDDSKMKNIICGHQNTQILYSTHIPWDYPYSFSLIKSINSGNTWTSIDNAPPYIIRNVDPQNDQVIFCASQTGDLFKSTDSGENFVIVDNNSLLNWRVHYIDGLHKKGRLDFEFDNSGTNIYSVVKGFSGNQYHFVVSDNSGNSWTILSSQANQFHIDVDNSQSGLVYKGSGTEIHVSYDYGNSFTLFQSIDYDIRGLYQKDGSDTLFVITEHHLYEVTSSSINPLMSLVFSQEHVLDLSDNCNITNRPNPFNPSTTIDFFVQNDSNVKLTVYNIKGHKIKTLADNEVVKGSHSVVWNGVDENGRSVSSGVYFYKLNVNGKTEAVKKCLLLK